MLLERIKVSFELKTLGAREFEGYGSTFGNVDLGDDVVLPGAFKQSLIRHKADGLPPQMFWMHQPDQVPGKWTELAEDTKGLYVKGELADTQLGNEMRTLLNMKAVRGLSIGFAIEDRQKDVSYDADGNRLLHKIDLWEVSLVSLAMNPMARITASKARLSQDGEYVPTAREFEKHLRDAGCSKNVARHLVSRVFDDDPGGMPDGHRWDAGDVEPGADEVLKSIERLTGTMIADSFRR